MSNRPKYYKLRERSSSRKQNTQILKFFNSEDNLPSPKHYENNDQDFSDAPPLKKTRESLQEYESTASTETHRPSPTCSTSNLEKVEKGESESLPKNSSITGKTKRNTKTKANNSIKTFFEQNDSDDEYAPKRKVAKKVTVSKTNSRAKTRGGKTRTKQPTIKSALLKNEEIFSEFVAQHSKAENVDPNELQLALAISKSEIEISGPCDGSAEEEKTDLKKNIRQRLKEYGFKIIGRERDYDIIFKAGSKRGKWENKFTPLTLRDSEKQVKKLEEKIAEILKCSSPKTVSSHTNNDFVITSDFLKMFVSDRDLCRTLHQIDSSYVYDYYVIELFPASDTKVGYLLKDWRKIPGRDLSPTRIKTEINNELHEVIQNIPSMNVIPGVLSDNENGSPKIVLDAEENENDFPDLITDDSENLNNLPEFIPDASKSKSDSPKQNLGSSENENNLLDSFSGGPENEKNLSKEILYSPHELSQEIILNNKERLAVNVSESINMSVDYPEKQRALCIKKTLKGKEKLISLDVCDVEIIKETSKELVAEKKKCLIDSDNTIVMMKYGQRETSPDLFADSDTSFCEAINDSHDSNEVSSPGKLEIFSEQNQHEPTEENFVISYEKYSSDEVKVSSNITHESPKSPNKELLRQPSLEEYFIDLTGQGNSDSASFGQEIQNQNNEINKMCNTEDFESIKTEMNLFQASQKSDYSNNLSQSQNNLEMDLTGDSCIVLSDDEVNYSIKVAHKICSDPVDLTFSSSSEDDQEKRTKTNYNTKMLSPKNDQNFSFIALIGETDIVSPSKSAESLNIDSPMKMSQNTNIQSDSKASARRNLFSSQNTGFMHHYSTPGKKSLSFSNYKNNISSDYEKLPYVERSAPYILADDELSTQSCSVLLNQSTNFDGEFPNVDHGVKFSKLRKSKIPPHTITSTLETTLGKSSYSNRTVSDSYIKGKTVEKYPLLKKYSISQKCTPYNLADDGERLVYDEFNMADYDENTSQDKLLNIKPPNLNKLLSSDEELSDDKLSVVKFSKHRKRRKSPHTITSTIEKKRETTSEKNSCSCRALSDSFLKSSTVMKSPILKKYAASQKFNKFIHDDVDFSDVDEIDKLVYSPIKKLTPKKPQGMDKLLHAELSFTEKSSSRKYVHDGKTYLVRVENISPKPDYVRMDSPTILKKLYNYGIKPLKRKHAIAILEHIYEQTHPFVVENSNDDSSDDEDILRISSSPLKELQVQKANKKSQSSYNTFNLEDCTGENLLEFDDLFPEIDVEDYIFPTNIRSKVSTAHLPFHIAWYNVVKSSYSLREAILHYEPIDLQEIYLFLKKLGYRYDPKDMKKFFDKRCIIFRYDLSDSSTNRHVRKNKGTLSERAL